MFTGIIENMAEIQSVDANGTNIDVWVKSVFTPSLKIDQSVSHNGICLTVVDIVEEVYKVTAIKETIAKTTVAAWSKGEKLNLERAMTSGARLDGHWVQGHVDTTAILVDITPLNGSWSFRFKFEVKPDFILVKKGSVCIDGVSLTVVDIDTLSFSVNIIPYTYKNTLFGSYLVGQSVNIEFDIIGKYIQSLIPHYMQNIRG